jgi:mono/diheme cytochrome c family protein
MSEHNGRASAARDEVIMGDLPNAKTQLAWLAEHREPLGVGAVGAPFLTALADASQAGASASSLTEAGTAIGRTTVACSGCHSAFQVRLPGITASPPSTEGHGKRSTWAIQAMWTGMLANSDNAWNAGAAGLAAGPLDLAGFGAADGGAGAQAAVATLKERAATLGQTTDRGARGEGLGAVIGACGQCHAERGVTGHTK